MSSNEVYAVLTQAKPASKPLRLVNGKATLFVAGLYNALTNAYASIPPGIEVGLQIRPYYNFDGTPWANNEQGWFTESIQTQNGFTGTIYLGGEWQVRAAIVSNSIGPSTQIGVVIGTSVESK
jgi:hypothetical protein